MEEKIEVIIMNRKGDERKEVSVEEAVNIVNREMKKGKLIITENKVGKKKAVQKKKVTKKDLKDEKKVTATPPVGGG